MPDYSRDPYINNLSEIDRMLLGSLYPTVDKEGSCQTSQEIKRLLGGDRSENLTIECGVKENECEER